MSSTTGTLPGEIERKVPPRPRSLWRNRDYLLLVSGQAVSDIGSQISFVAFPLLMFALTNSAVQAGLMSAVRSLPRLLFILPAGALVDRWDRKRTMFFCDLGRALALGSIPLALWLGGPSYTQLYLVALIEGTLSTLYQAAESSAYPHVVAPEQLPDASSQNEVLLSLSAMLGPALGPILFSVGSFVPFLSDAVSYVVSAFSLFFINANFQEERGAGNKGMLSLWKEIGEGVAWLWRHSTLRFLAIMTFGLMTPCFGYLLVIITLSQQMHASSTAMGLILGASGVGSIVGALLAGPLYRRFGFVRILLVSAWIWALTWLFYALAPDIIWLGIVNALSFIIVPIYSSTQYSYRLSVIPDALQGRVNSVFRLIAFGGQPLGIAVTGLLLQFFGPFTTVVLLFVPQGLLCLMATFYRRTLTAK